MEDYHLALPDFDLPRGLALYGVFDGHGGNDFFLLAQEALRFKVSGLRVCRFWK